MAKWTRDPLSVRFDSQARKLVERAYAAGMGTWAGAYVPPPGPRARLWMASEGIDPYERDRWGEIRYLRAYKRAAFHLVNYHGGVKGLREEKNLGAGTHGWHAPVRGEWQTGLRNAEGLWAVRMRLWPAGEGDGKSETSRRGRRLGTVLGNRWIDDDGRPTFRQSTIDDHDWEQRAG